MNNPAYFAHLAKYNIWANNLTISWLQQISEADWERNLGGSMPTIAATAVHIAGAEKVWLERFEQSAEPFLSSYFTGTRSEALDIWKNASANLLKHVEQLTVQNLEESFAYTNIKGEELTSKKWEALAHVFNHSSYHRGQIVNYLRQIGFIGVESTDLIRYFRLNNDN